MRIESACILKQLQVETTSLSETFSLSCLSEIEISGSTSGNTGTGNSTTLLCCLAGIMCPGPESADSRIAVHLHWDSAQLVKPGEHRQGSYYQSNDSPGGLKRNSILVGEKLFCIGTKAGWKTTLQYYLSMANLQVEPRHHISILQKAASLRRCLQGR